MNPISHSPRVVRGALFVAMFAGTALAAPQQANPMVAQLRWSNGINDTFTQMSPASLKSSLESLSARQDRSRVLVTLTKPLSVNERARLR